MRLIDLDSLISNLEKMESYNCSPMYRRGYDDCISTIKRQTIVDAVEVVRCKDCSFWTYEGVGFSTLKLFGRCKKWYPYGGEQSSCYDDDFCSQGERKDD